MLTVENVEAFADSDVAADTCRKIGKLMVMLSTEEMRLLCEFTRRRAYETARERFHRSVCEGQPFMSYAEFCQNKLHSAEVAR